MKRPGWFSRAFFVCRDTGLLQRATRSFASNVPMSLNADTVWLADVTR